MAKKTGKRSAASNDFLEPLNVTGLTASNVGTSRPYLATANTTSTASAAGTGAAASLAWTLPALSPAATSHSSMITTARSVPDIFDNAKYEALACIGLKPRYDGSPKDLLPTLDLIDVRRKNEAWYHATLIDQDGGQVDLITQFSKVKTAVVLTQAKNRWDVPDAMNTSHLHGSETYSARLLARFLQNSLSQEFLATLLGRFDKAYCNDGPLLLHTMCQHIHRTHLVFTESIKNQIRNTGLEFFKMDVVKYLEFVRSNLRLITSTGDNSNEHKDLNLHLLNELRISTIPQFQSKILKWQKKYLEGKIDFSPLKLMEMADTEQQVLHHAGQWTETISPQVTALQASVSAIQDGTSKVFIRFIKDLYLLTI
jgi:hypothetical protein